MMKKYNLAVISIIVSSFLTGCFVSSSRNQVADLKGKTLDPAKVPTYLEGDRITYIDGKKERVTKTEDGKVFWKRSKVRNWVADADFILPREKYQSRRKQSEEVVTRKEGEIWPLRIGNETTFYSTKSVNNHEPFFYKESNRKWQCQVDGVSEINSLIGAYETYRIECRKFNADNYKSSGTQKYWFYSPELEHYLFAIEYKSSKSRSPLKETEILSIQRGMKWLSSKEKKSLYKARRRAMENTNTGDHKKWVSKDKKTIVKIYPSKKLTMDNGVLCRNYKEVIKHDDIQQVAAGLLCRESKNKWKQPYNLADDKNPILQLL